MQRGQYIELFFFFYDGYKLLWAVLKNSAADQGFVVGFLFFKRVCSKERGEHNFAACVSVKRSFAKRFGFITSYAFTTH
jgi:hypothetical protein